MQYDNCNATVDQMCHNRHWTYLRLEEGVRGLSGLFGGILPTRPFPGGGTGFLGGTNGAAGLVGLCSGTGLSTEMEMRERRAITRETGTNLKKN